ncbi:MAG: hypothetical protein H6833_10940 [Planctomycetes bacterium]|nr:hypothetical protein [Planctomycetota bacterium]
MTRILSGGALVLLSTASLNAQEPARQAAQSVIDATTSLERHGRELRGFGAQYRMNFDDHGFLYTPALGLAAPRSMGWRFELESVRRGETTLWRNELPLDVAVASSLDDTRARIARGPHITETYDVRPDGVKQSFVFDRPTGSGDLVVRGRVVSELRPTQSGDALEVDYTFAGIGGVHLGQVIGIDEAGTRATGSYTVGEGYLEMRLPASFVDAARGQIVLDPLVGNRGGNGGANYPDNEPAVAFDAVNDVYLFVWERIYSASDIQVNGVIRDTTLGTVMGVTIADTGSNRNAEVTRLAALGGFVVTYDSAPNVFGVRSIQARFVSGSTGSVGPAVELSGPDDNYEPTIAGSSDPSVPLCLVAWTRRDAGIRMRLVAVGGPSIIAAATAITVSTDGNHTQPCLSPSTTLLHALTYQVYVPSGNRHSIRVHRFAANGTENGNSRTIASTSFDRTSPAIDGDGSSFRLVHVEGAVGSRDTDIREVQLEWDGSGNVTVPSGDIIAQTTDAEFEPAVCLLGPNYLVAWSSSTLLDGQRSVHLMTRNRNSCGPCGSQHTVAGSNASDATPQVVGRYSSDPTQSEGVVTWSSFETTVPFLSQMHMQRFAAFGGSSLSRHAGGCGTSPSITASGIYAIGSPNFQLDMTGAGAATLASFLMIDFEPGLLPCGSCQILDTSFIYPATMTGSGSARFASPIPCDPNFDGVDLYFQFLAFGAASTACPILDAFSFTPTLTGTLRE